MSDAFNPLFDMAARSAAIRNGGSVGPAEQTGHPASSMVAGPDLFTEGLSGDFGSPLEALGLSQEQMDEMQPLYLSVDQATRDSLKDKGLGHVLPDGSFPIRDGEEGKSDLKKAIDLRGHGSHPQIGAHLKAAAKRLGATDMLPDELRASQAPTPADLSLAGMVKCPECDTMNPPDAKKCKKCGYDLSKTTKLSQEDPMSAAIIFQPHINLSVEQPDDGLVWKCVCEEGTLALSPGPGQIDVESPLNLTADLMDNLKESVDEGAFPYVTIPKTHNNGLLENTGYVPKGKAEIRLSEDGRKQLWCGLEFKDEEVDEKARKGLIADTSVGVKFNYRNKRTGKTYPAALEHVNLTNQPWVDGMPAFGLSQDGIFDADLMLSQEDFKGIFTDLDEEPTKDTETPAEGDTLPGVSLSSTVPAMAEKRTVEQVLAAQQAEIERLKQDAVDKEQKLSLAQGTINAQGDQLHASGVDKYIGSYNGKVDPSFLVRAREVMLADTPSNDGTLKLSITSGEGEEVKTEEKEFTPTDVVKYLLSALPAKEENQFDELILSVDGRTATLKPAEADSATSGMAAADEIERDMHPDRFDAEGKRKDAVS